MGPSQIIKEKELRKLKERNRGKKWHLRTAVCVWEGGGEGGGRPPVRGLHSCHEHKSEQRPAVCSLYPVGEPVSLTLQ